MTMKLPIILSAMVAALAVPSFASQAEAEPKADAATDASAPAAGEEHKATKKKKARKSHHKHSHNHAHKHHENHSGAAHTPDEQDKAYDEQNPEAGPGKIGLPAEVPGEKGPNVPRGE